LGDPEQVADAAVTAYRQRSFLGRHAWAAFLVFGVSPVVSIVGFFVLMCFVMRLSGHLIDMVASQMGILGNNGYLTAPASPVELTVGRCLFSLLTIIIPAMLASTLYCILAKRCLHGKAWILTSCGVLAIVALSVSWDVSNKIIDASGHYAVYAGLWIPGVCGWAFPISILQLLQFSIPLAIGLWFLWRRHIQERLHLAS
jgi:hypothetical protein